MTAPSLATHVGAVALPNPLMTASGTAGHGDELAAYMDLSTLGAVVVKSFSVGPWPGNPAPRLHPLPTGMLNSVGLQNGGVDHWLEAELPPLAATGARVVASIWGSSAGDYAAVAGRLADAVRAGRTAGVVAVEANISCPNVEDRRRMFAHSCEGVTAAVGAAAAGLDGSLPLWVKLSPNVTDLPAMAEAAAAAGAGAVTLVNTVMGMAIDPASGRFLLGNGGGGLSGPAVHPIAVRAVYETRAALPDLPIVGVGGVSAGADAAELIAAGADAVQVGTASFAEPGATARVLSELGTWMTAHDVSSIAALKGRAHARN
jgi:dihydroorotate dehydrogenase (NAD+) catalytic subunit